MTNQYTVISASAGSGKTYALVQRLLSICLKYPNQPENIRHILALTFTNKAANEMKERILEWLKNFASEDYVDNQDLRNIQKKLENEQIKVTLEDLHFRAKKILDYVLHHYSTLNIGTIDKFNSRLVRSFSYELGLPQNFNLEIQAEPFLIEAVDKVLDKIGENKNVSDAFMDFVHYSLDNNERVNLSDTLYQSAKEFVQDKNYFRLDENKDFDWESYEKNTKKIRFEIQLLKKDNIEITKNIERLLIEKNLEISDFAGGKSNSIAKFFAEAKRYYLKQRDGFPFPGNEESANETFLKGNSASGKNKESEILEILDFLLDNRKKVIANYILSQRKEKILRAILPLKVNKEIQDQLIEIEEENDLVLLSKFNIMIHENLRNEPSSFIYEKVGTQFHHYFFDEFQDTSQLQWQNFLPLRDHTITSENMSFTLVGDPKQSIYRFRGGDSKMMLDIIQNKEKTPVDVSTEVLDTNWRSAKNIVEFNNQLYQFLSIELDEEHQTIFGKDAQQKANANFEGRVKINLLENAPKQNFMEDCAEKMQNDIQECLDAGFRLSDITILCRGNYEIFRYSQLLGNKKVNYHGNEIYLKTISDKGLTLELSPTILATIEFLKWETNPKNLQFLVKMMYYLGLSGRIDVPDFTDEMLKILENKSKQEIEGYIAENYPLQLNPVGIPQLNLYNYIEYYLQEFLVENKETDYLLNFLEMLYNYSQNTGYTLKDFLKYWEEDGRTISIQASENIDAVQLMTIHKSKGLEFPIVFLPMENANKDGKFSAWFATDEENLNSVIISPFEKALENYDEEMLKFNQENLYQNKLDRFCLQYVATTRAVEQLFFYIEKPNKTSNHLEIYDFVENLQVEKFKDKKEYPDSFDVFDANENILKKQKNKSQTKQQSKGIDHLKNQFEKNGEIKIATPSKNYQERNPKVKQGIFVHEILSKMVSEKDLPKVLNTYIIQGLITENDAEIISDRILNVIRDAQFAPYFSENLKIINEKEIMISENGKSQLYRPDRMVETKEGIIVIDFKTGLEKEKYEKQIATYKTALEKLGKKVIETKLIYL